MNTERGSWNNSEGLEMNANIIFNSVEPSTMVLTKRKELVIQDCHGYDFVQIVKLIGMPRADHFDSP